MIGPAAELHERFPAQRIGECCDQQQTDTSIEKHSIVLLSTGFVKLLGMGSDSERVFIGQSDRDRAKMRNYSLTQWGSFIRPALLAWYTKYISPENYYSTIPSGAKTQRCDSMTLIVVFVNGQIHARVLANFKSLRRRRGLLSNSNGVGHCDCGCVHLHQVSN